MISINITEETSTNDNMASLLRRIADLIDEGYTSGYEPDWDLFGQEELDERDADDSILIEF
jgi:hypothetical protein